MRHQAHHQRPRRASVNLVLAYKNFAALKGISHIGLGVAARNTAAVLRREGFRAQVWPLDSATTLGDLLARSQTALHAHKEHPISHIVISAPWVPTLTLQQLTMQHTEVCFAVSSHSNVGFLQADPNGIKLLRESYQLAVGVTNFRAVGNNRRYADWVERAHGVPCAWLPNLYDMQQAQPQARGPWAGGVLRLGCFGASRPLKNAITAAAAAIEVGRRMHADLEFWINVGRDCAWLGTLNLALRQMLENIPRVTLKAQSWQSWPEFRQTVGSMNLLLQPSFTESFNMVSADGISQGVATVASPSIEWLPHHWQVDPDDAGAIADRAIGLLHDPHTPQAGHRALRDYVSKGILEWTRYLLAPM